MMLVRAAILGASGALLSLVPNVWAVIAGPGGMLLGRLHRAGRGDKLCGRGGEAKPRAGARACT